MAIAGRELLGVLVLAYYRGWRGRVLRVDTGHVLTALVEVVKPPFARSLEGVDQTRAGSIVEPIANVAAASHSDPFVAEVDRLLREVVWVARHKLYRGFSEPAPAWSDDVRCAVKVALIEGEAAGVQHCHPAHLFAGLASEENRAVALCRAAGFDPQMFVSQLRDGVMAREGLPHSVGLGVWEKTGVIGRPQSAVSRLRGASTRVRLARWRPNGFQPVAFAVTREAVRQAVRLDAEQVEAWHVLLALLVLHDQSLEIGLRLRGRWESHNEGGQLLKASGASVGNVADLLSEPAYRKATAASSESRMPARSRSDPPFGQDVVEVERRAQHIAKRAGHYNVGTLHILLSLLQDPAGGAKRAMSAVGVDVLALSDEALRKLKVFSSDL